MAEPKFWGLEDNWLTAANVNVFVYAPDGGATTTAGSAADYIKTFAYAPDGGALTTAGSVAAISKTFVYAPDGGALTTSGAAVVAKNLPYSATGGATTGGSATLSKTKVYTAAGGAVTGGAAITVFVPASAAGGNWITAPASLWWHIPSDIRDRMLRWGVMPEPEPVDGKRTKTPKRTALKRKLQTVRARIIQQSRLLPEPQIFEYKAKGGFVAGGAALLNRSRVFVALTSDGPVFRVGGAAEVQFFQFTPAYLESLQREDETLLSMLD